ncbi:MarP family serine protease [Vallicoccus soli]|uniref:Serine protease n=1 Tax=Vallicoccus soli TaxID=2339232 RepID=A0A3A3Z3Z0_9ACTN|nr:MarP family serine protease [Vallicoccus soli]RJK97673.1 serine protease [Vallicoccus soli]
MDLTWVDAALLLACLAVGLSGLRQGFLVGLLSFAGFLGGGVLGMLLVPEVVGSWDPGLAQVVAAVALVVAVATVGQVLLGWAALRLRAALRWRPARMLDSGAGALLGVASLLVVAWFVGAALRQAPLPTVAREVAASRVLSAVDRVMPDDAQGLFGSFRSVLGDNGFPQVFGGLSPERIAPVDPPSGGAVGSAGVRGAAGSVVRLDGQARDCGRSIEGSGFVYEDGLVMTNAHVVAGVDEPRVRVGGRGASLEGEVVVFDPQRDLAVVRVPGLDAPPLQFVEGAGRGDEAVVAGFPRGGPYRLDPARVREQITARGQDIYDERRVARSVLSLYALVQPGNSGGPLLAPDGRVYGVVFAKSLDDPDTGYALSLEEVAPVAEAGRTADGPVDTRGCTG